MKRRVITTIVLTGGLLAVCGFGTAGAQTRTPSQADYDACNQQAQARSNPSASPSMSPGTSSTPGMANPSPGTPRPPGTATSPTLPTPPPATGTMPGSFSASDSVLRGMGQAGEGDMAYQQAYRDCMKQRGF